eukprot:4362463-Amphidinium_carterae.2
MPPRAIPTFPLGIECRFDLIVDLLDVASLGLNAHKGVSDPRASTHLATSRVMQLPPSKDDRHPYQERRHADPQITNGSVGLFQWQYICA